MEPQAAAEVLEKALKDPRAPVTVADAAAASGLALRDAERGLNWLTSTYRGHLRVTEEGQLLFLYPYGFTKPWETRDALRDAFRAALRVLGGVARFVVRAWLTIAIFAYAGAFLAILLGLTLARQGSSDRDGLPGSALLYVVFRVLADALFWTFHPFSPLAIGAGPRAFESEPTSSRRGAASSESEGVPFYEKVNRFVFGPTEAPPDPREMERRIVAEIRAQKGRIGLGDVMRVTGLPREEADPMMARLMLDYDGDVDVSEGGGITYRFEALRKTALETGEPRPAPAWTEQKRVPPLTGNPPGSNVLVGLLNGFNLVMGLFALDANLTLGRLMNLYDMIRAPHHVVVPPIPYDGIPLAFGVVPLVFSLALFALPLGRALLLRLRAREVAHENGRLGLLREVLTRVNAKAPLTEPALEQAWTQAAGQPPAPKELTRVVVELGGDVQLEESGEVRYRFVDLETEAEALEEERAVAKDEEAKVGRVVFGSDT
jgi:hypothetical protein